MLNDKRIKSCLSRFDSRLQFLRAVSHFGANMESLQPRVDSSSSSSSEDEDEASQAPAATTSAASKSATAASASDDCCELVKCASWRHGCWFHTGAVWTCTLLLIIRTYEERTYRKFLRVLLKWNNKKE